MTIAESLSPVGVGFVKTGGEAMTLCGKALIRTKNAFSIPGFVICCGQRKGHYGPCPDPFAKREAKR